MPLRDRREAALRAAVRVEEPGLEPGQRRLVGDVEEDQHADERLARGEMDRLDIVVGLPGLAHRADRRGAAPRVEVSSERGICVWIPYSP